MSKPKYSKKEAKKIILEYLSQFQNYKSVNNIYNDAFNNELSIDSIRKYTRELMLEGVLERKMFIRLDTGVGKSGLVYGYRLIR